KFFSRLNSQSFSIYISCNSLQQELRSFPTRRSSDLNKVAIAHREKDSFKVLLSATTFQTDGQKYKLIAFQNVNEALDETESKAWQKLLSVMTHEIMNSVAPISSLAETLKHRLQQNKKESETEPGSMDDLELGIDTI